MRRRLTPVYRRPRLTFADRHLRSLRAPTPPIERQNQWVLDEAVQFIESDVEILRLMPEAEPGSRRWSCRRPNLVKLINA